MLTLFFIDEVAKYRDYSAADEKGDYARIFEEEYRQYLNEVLDLDETPYIKYLKGIDAGRTHSGYFSIDKKTKRLADPDVEKRGENAGLSNDVDAYDLILKDKERLLSFAEPVRFIFSHSALREGWTTQMCSSFVRSSTATTPFRGGRKLVVVCACPLTRPATEWITPPSSMT